MTPFQDVFNYPFHSLPFDSFQADGWGIHSWGDNKAFLWQLSVLRPPYLVILIDSELGAVAGRVHADVTVRVVGHKQVSARQGESAGSGRGRRPRAAPAEPRGAARARGEPRGAPAPGGRGVPSGGLPPGQGIVRGGRVSCDALIVRKIIIKSDISRSPTQRHTHTQNLQRLLSLSANKKAKVTGTEEIKTVKKKKKSVLAAAVAGGELRGPAAAVRAGHPFPSSSPGQLSRPAAPARRAAAGGVPSPAERLFPAAAAPTGMPESLRRGWAVDPGERSWARRVWCFLSALTSFSLGDPRLNLHREAETECCRRLFPPRPAEIQAVPFEVSQGTAEAPPPVLRHSCGHAQGVSRLPQHGAPSAPAAPRSRPGVSRVRPLPRRSQPTAAAGGRRSSAERIGAGRYRPGVGVSGLPGAGAGISGRSRWSPASIGDKSEQEEAADRRPSAVGGVPQPTRRARCRVSEPGAAAAAPDSTFPSPAAVCGGQGALRKANS